MESTPTSRVTPLREPGLEREPQQPENTEAEQALLGAILINNAAYGRVTEFLSAEHFGNAVHGRIYAAIGKLLERGQIANPITLKNLFDQDAALIEIGGAQYLARLAASAVTIVNAEHYGRTIHDLHFRRELITIGQDVVTDAFSHDLDDPAVEQIERAEQRLFELAETGRSGVSRLQAVSIASALQRAEAAYKGEGVGLLSGLRDLDNKLGGFRSANLIILAGRPSMGKSALAITIGLNVAKGGLPAVIFSLEMSRDEIEDRIFAGLAGISADRIRRGAVSARAFEDFIEIERRLAALPLLIDDDSGTSVAQLRARARRLKRQKGLGLIIVDYLQLLRPSSRARPSDGRVQEVSDITRGLKAVAKELEVPVLACAQLSRGVEQREDKRPMLADLRESGSIEQDADVVMFIFREEYYLGRRDPASLTEKEAELLATTRNKAEVIIAKNRSGPIARVGLFFDATLTRFANLDPRAADEREAAEPSPIRSRAYDA
jgi:replicative DNA helicase